MCAIFGSSKFDIFCKLYDLNKPRGISASSALTLTDKHEVKCKKTAGAFDEYSLEKSKLYLGHCQAPTTQKQEFDYETAHPFYFDRFYVAHNGIITNAEDLAKEYNLKLFKKTQVDSSVVPELISQVYCSGSPLQLPEVIKVVAEKLKGTFACFIYSERDNRVFLIRSGSTLFYDKEGNFSSTKFDRSIPFEEGKVGEFVSNKIIYHCPFITNSPFFI